jgi:hypothetical protein
MKRFQDAQVPVSVLFRIARKSHKTFGRLDIETRRSQDYDYRRRRVKSLASEGEHIHDQVHEASNASHSGVARDGRSMGVVTSQKITSNQKYHLPLKKN